MSGRLARALLGVAVFVALLVVWQVAAEGSFQVPTASEVLERSWQSRLDRPFLVGSAGVRRDDNPAAPGPRLQLAPRLKLR